MEQDLHSITYTAGEDWQFRESLISRDLFFGVFYEMGGVNEGTGFTIFVSAR